MALSPAMDPFTCLRSLVDDAYPRWAPGAETFETTAGPRYRTDDVVRLLRNPLAEIGLRGAYVPASGSYDEREVFALADGTHVSRRRLRAILHRILDDHPDLALRGAADSRKVADALLLVLPTLDAPLSPAPLPASYNSPRAATGPDAEYIEFYLGDLRAPTRTAAAYAGYVATAEADGVRPIGKARFFATALASGRVTRRRRRDGEYLLPINLDEE